MRLGPTSVLWLLAVSAGAADLRVSTADCLQRAVTNRVAILSPIALTGMPTNALPVLDPRRATTDTAGVCWFSNAVAGLYRLDLVAVPPTSFRVLIPDQSGTVQAHEIRTTMSTTNAEGTVAWSIAASDARYALKSEGGVATNSQIVVAGDNVTVTTNGLLRTISGVSTNGFVGPAITNGLASTDYVWTAIAAATNGLGISVSTNGLATTGYVWSAIAQATNGLGTGTSVSSNDWWHATNSLYPRSNPSNFLTAIAGNGSGLTNIPGAAIVGAVAFADSAVAAGTAQSLANGWTITEDGAGYVFTGAMQGNGSRLTNINASALASGTVPAARLSDITSNQLDAATWLLATQQVAGSSTVYASNIVSGGQLTAAAIPANMPTHSITNGGATNTLLVLQGRNVNTPILSITNDLVSASGRQFTIGPYYGTEDGLGRWNIGASNYLYLTAPGVIYVLSPLLMIQGNASILNSLTASNLVVSRGTNAVSIRTNSVAPADATTVRAWEEVRDGTNVFKRPLYQ